MKKTTKAFIFLGSASFMIAGLGLAACSSTTTTIIDDGGTANKDGTTSDGGPTKMSAVAMGAYSGCALGVDGSIWCWGANTFGALGVTPIGPVRASAKMVAGLPTMIQLSAGNTHVCAVSQTNDVWCWGTNKYGELGHDPAIDGACAPNVPCSGAPTKVPSLKATKVVGLQYGTCALTTTGDVTCWGLGDAGILGTNAVVDAGGVPTATTKSFLPVTIAGLPVHGVAELGGNSWTGTSACAIVTGGEVRCWGANLTGNLGHAPATNGDVAGDPGSHCQGACNSTPQTVSYNGGTLNGAFSVFGGFTNCMVKQSDQSIVCWGSDGCGQLGNSGATADGGFAPSSPAALPALLASQSVLTGSAGDAVCAVLKTGDVMCWGDDTAGIVGASLPPACSITSTSTPGNGTSTARTQPGLHATAVSVGHTAAAVVDTDGHVQAWGENSVTGILGHAPGSGRDDTSAQNRSVTPSYVDGLGP